MDLFLKASTNVPDLIIDFIEVRLKSGKTVSLNWEKSCVTRLARSPSAGFKKMKFTDDKNTLTVEDAYSAKGVRADG